MSGVTVAVGKPDSEDVVAEVRLFWPLNATEREVHAALDRAVTSAVANMERRIGNG